MTGKLTPVRPSDTSHSRRPVPASAAASESRTRVGAPRSSAGPSGPMNSPPTTVGSVAAYNWDSAPRSGDWAISGLPIRPKNSRVRPRVSRVWRLVAV
ncbi:hypothetical protein BN2537_8511 [Streptomyces venezuelae]|nr:hypothetical protein BN2537_8511 [Streptomyces venezuelae]